MANTATVYARIDPELKADVDNILSQLGVTPSSLVQMLYKQIKLTRSIPFGIKLPAGKVLSLDELSTEELNVELQKGYDSTQAGKVHSVREVDEMMKRDYGI